MLGVTSDGGDQWHDAKTLHHNPYAGTPLAPKAAEELNITAANVRRFVVAAAAAGQALSVCPTADTTGNLDRIQRQWFIPSVAPLP